MIVSCSYQESTRSSLDRRVRDAATKTAASAPTTDRLAAALARRAASNDLVRMLESLDRQPDPHVVETMRRVIELRHDFGIEKGPCVVVCRAARGCTEPDATRAAPHQTTPSKAR